MDLDRSFSWVVKPCVSAEISNCQTWHMLRPTWFISIWHLSSRWMIALGSDSQVSDLQEWLANVSVIWSWGNSKMQDLIVSIPESFGTLNKYNNYVLFRFKLYIRNVGIANIDFNYCYLLRLWMPVIITWLVSWLTSS